MFLLLIDPSLREVSKSIDYKKYVPKEMRDFIVEDRSSDEEQKLDDDEKDVMTSFKWSHIAALGYVIQECIQHIICLLLAVSAHFFVF